MKKLVFLALLLTVIAPAASASADDPVFTVGPPVVSLDPPFPVSDAIAMAQDAAYKAANDTDPHVPLNAEQEGMLAVKEQAVAAYLTSLAGKKVTITPNGAPDAAVVNANPTAIAATPTSASILANQQAQQTSYWCGPAAVAEALGQLGISMSQSTAASKLGTTKSGTAWSGGPTKTGRPVPDVLNGNQSKLYYTSTSVPGSPSSSDINNYKSFLVTDLTVPKAPLVGDAWETPTSAHHLVGHPSDHEIFHWFDIRGYTSSGANTMYEDSVHGATSIGWSANVPAYSTLSSSWIVGIVGGRGYVW